jgi:hypothetical protein
MLVLYAPKQTGCCTYGNAQHLIGIFSIMGILPAYMSTLSYLDHEGSNYNYLVEHRQVTKKQKEETTLLEMLSYAIQTALSITLPYLLHLLIKHSKGKVGSVSKQSKGK